MSALQASPLDLHLEHFNNRSVEDEEYPLCIPTREFVGPKDAYNQLSAYASFKRYMAAIFKANVGCFIYKVISAIYVNKTIFVNCV